MTNIDKELIEWAIDMIEKKYKDDVSLLIGQFGACKLPTDEQKMAFDYYVPATERGYQLAETFIIEDMGYDLYPMSFERLEGIADFQEPRMIWVLEKSEVLYAREEVDRKRFEQIKEKLHINLQNKQKTFYQALKFLDVAMEVYNTMLFEENICKIRKAAGGVSSMLAYSLAMVNGLALVDGYGNLIKEVNKMKVKPEKFVQIYQQIIEAALPEEILEHSRKLIQEVRKLLGDMKENYKLAKVDKEGIHYEDLAFWYQEARYTFRKIAYYAEIGYAPQCYSLGCYLQIEFDAIQEDFGLKEMDLLGKFHVKNLNAFAKRAKELEQYIVQMIQENGVKLNEYESLEMFLKYHKM
ncbi:MAG: hypothetical protein IJO85_10985 [Lachnospiraceae bacterium]|nr:hypothetical protein [Lachnospiraceae bacterium]